MDLLCSGAGLQCPPHMAVHCALGTNGCRGAQLHQLNDLLFQRAGLAHGLAQRLHGVEIIRMLLPQPLIGLQLTFLFHATLLMLDVRRSLPLDSGKAASFRVVAWREG